MYTNYKLTDLSTINFEILMVDILMKMIGGDFVILQLKKKAYS